jgi:hypothetical protein
MDNDSDLYAVINNAVTNTQSEIHTNQINIQVRNIFEIYKPSEKLRFTPFETKIHNKFLLWQGVKN